MPSFHHRPVDRVKERLVQVGWDDPVGGVGGRDCAALSGRQARPPTKGIEKMLRMYLQQCWFNLSDESTEDAIYDSYAMRKFVGVDFL